MTASGREGRPTALVTGATAGLGAEFARRLAASGHHLVLVARDRERLRRLAEELRAAHGVLVEVLPADLLKHRARARVESRLRDRARPIGLLVNNAGFGVRGRFETTAVDDEQAQLDLLVTVPLRLSHAALPGMLDRGSGTIINVASVAAFSPRGTYGAAKRWVVSFSEWAHLEYRDRGVTVMALAPGFVRTEFHERMGMRTDTIPEFLWLDAEQVVRIALRDAGRGRGLSVPTLRYRFIVWLSGVLPRRLAARGSLTARTR